MNNNPENNTIKTIDYKIILLARESVKLNTNSNEEKTIFNKLVKDIKRRLKRRLKK